LIQHNEADRSGHWLVYRTDSCQFLCWSECRGFAAFAAWVGSGQDAQVASRSPVPTYYWGPGGSGKSHLLKAAREALREQGARAGWLDATVQDAPEFSESWAAVLMDDVHLYTAAQQQTAFNWFVNAQALQRPVMAAGGFAPVELKLREDLRTRLGWGHVFGLHPLSEPERRAVLRQAADARGVFLSDEVMDFMLTRFPVTWAA